MGKEPKDDDVVPAADDDDDVVPAADDDDDVVVDTADDDVLDLKLEDIVSFDEVLTKEPPVEKDMSWFLAAVDRKGDAWILDAAEGFYDYDVFLEHSAEDNGVIVPEKLAVGLYHVSNIYVGQDGHPEDPYTYVKGDWMMLTAFTHDDDPKRMEEKLNHATHVLYQDGDDGIPDAVKDRNGEVVLGLCKRCGAGEIELGQKSCVGHLMDQIKALEARVK